MAKVATDTGLPLSTVSRYERGQIELRPDQVLSIERVLRFAIDARAKELAKVVAGWPVAEQPVDRAAASTYEKFGFAGEPSRK